MGKRGSASTRIAASPEQVWALISDITRMGEWSPETVKAEWIDGATGPVAGARFKGTNKAGLIRWSTKPTVEVAEPGKEFTFATGKPGKPATRWSYKLTPSGDGTEVTESWEEVNTIPLVGGLITPGFRVRKLNEGCAKTLERIKAAAER